MAAILDFQVAHRVDFINIAMGITVPNLVLVSQFAQFRHKIDVICPTKTDVDSKSVRMLRSRTVKIGTFREQIA